MAFDYKEFFWGCSKTCVPWWDKWTWEGWTASKVSSSKSPGFHSSAGRSLFGESVGVACDPSVDEPYMGSSYEITPLGKNYLTGTPEDGFHAGFGNGNFMWGMDYADRGQTNLRENPLYIWDYVKEQSMSVSAGWTPSEGSWPFPTNTDASRDAVKAWEQNWNGFYSGLDPDGLYALFVHGSTNHAEDVQASISTNTNHGIPFKQIDSSTYRNEAKGILRQFCPLVQIGDTRLAWTTSHNHEAEWRPYAHPPHSYWEAPVGGGLSAEVRGVYPKGDFSKVHLPTDPQILNGDALAGFAYSIPNIMSATGVTERGTPFALFHGDRLTGSMAGGGVPNAVKFTDSQPQIKLELWYTTHFGGWKSYNTGTLPSFEARFILRKMRSLYRVWCQNLHPDVDLVGLRCERLQGGLVQDFPLLPPVKSGECNSEEYMIEMNFPFGGNEGYINPIDAGTEADLIQVYGLFSDGSTQLGMKGKHPAVPQDAWMESGNRGFKRHLALRFEPLG